MPTEPFLADWWANQRAGEREAREIEHQYRLLRPDLLAAQNRPVSVHDWNNVRNGILQLLGVTP